MPFAIYLIGLPGVGKTTALDIALGGIEGQECANPFKHICYPGGVMLGAKRARFSGTDALPMNVQPKVLDFLAKEKPAVVVGEGDRLGNGKFFDGLQALGYQLTVFSIFAPRYVIQERLVARGSNQDAKWLAGRETKVRGLEREWKPQMLDGLLSPEALGELLRAHPIVQMLLGKL